MESPHYVIYVLLNTFSVLLRFCFVFEFPESSQSEDPLFKKHVEQRKPHLFNNIVICAFLPRCPATALSDRN
jgi:hypothetical protein